MGYRIRRLFFGVFVAGSALAGLGGALWGLYQESVTVHIGANMMVLIFIVIIIGGLGSIGGCFAGALLVGPGGELRRLPFTQDRARLEHPADGARPAVAPAGALSGEQAMISTLLSGDLPRSRILTAMLVVILAALALAPFVFPGTRPLDVAAKVCVFVLLVASYDLLLGYTGIVSFAHTMFFGIGGYGIAIALSRIDVSWASIAIGAAAAVALSLILSFLIGLFSLRGEGDFFAMITLAWPRSSPSSPRSSPRHRRRGRHHLQGARAAAAATLRWLKALPRGTHRRARFVTYYSCSGVSLVLFLALLRVVNSPFGRCCWRSAKRFPRRGAGLPHRHLPHHRNCLGRWWPPSPASSTRFWLRYTGRTRRSIRDHDRHPADGGDRRHGPRCTARDRRELVRRGAELPAGSDEGVFRIHEGPAAAARPVPP
jgi:ABC-type branched-subunit amino acid transport system permease subunit